jgi:hypothetical protein
LESNEFELRQQLHDFQIKSDLLEKKLLKQEQVFHLDREKWSRERSDLERSLKEEIENLKEEKETIRIQSQHEIKNKITEVSFKFNQIQREMEVANSLSVSLCLSLSVSSSLSLFVSLSLCVSH